MKFKTSLLSMMTVSVVLMVCLWMVANARAQEMQDMPYDLHAGRFTQQANSNPTHRQKRPLRPTNTERGIGEMTAVSRRFCKSNLR